MKKSLANAFIEQTTALLFSGVACHFRLKYVSAFELYRIFTIIETTPITVQIFCITMWHIENLITSQKSLITIKPQETFLLYTVSLCCQIKTDFSSSSLNLDLSYLE
jgi:hypothetical protein